jgi:hypothetical protein
MAGNEHKEEKTSRVSSEYTQIILLSFTTLRTVERHVANVNVVSSNLIGVAIRQIFDTPLVGGDPSSFPVESASNVVY